MMIHLAISQAIIACESHAIIACKNYNRVTVGHATLCNYCTRYRLRIASGKHRRRSHLHNCLLQAIMQMNMRFSSTTANHGRCSRTCCVQAQGVLSSVEYNEIGRTRDSRETQKSLGKSHSLAVQLHAISTEAEAGDIACDSQAIIACDNC